MFFGPAAEDVAAVGEELKAYGRFLLVVVDTARVTTPSVTADVLDSVVAYAASEPAPGTALAVLRPRMCRVLCLLTLCCVLRAACVVS